MYCTCTCMYPPHCKCCKMYCTCILCSSPLWCNWNIWGFSGTVISWSSGVYICVKCTLALLSLSYQLLEDLVFTLNCKTFVILLHFGTQFSTRIIRTLEQCVIPGWPLLFKPALLVFLFPFTFCCVLWYTCACCYVHVHVHTFVCAGETERYIGESDCYQPAQNRGPEG